MEYPIDTAELAQALHERNVRYGFKTEGEPRDPVHVTLLVMSELVEAFEELRKGYAPDYCYFSCKPCKVDIHLQPDVLEMSVKHPDVYLCPQCMGPLKPEGFAVEYADAMIRLLDAGPELGIDYDYLVPHKMAFNDTREPKHGKMM